MYMHMWGWRVSRSVLGKAVVRSWRFCELNQNSVLCLTFHLQVLPLCYIVYIGWWNLLFLSVPHFSFFIYIFFLYHFPIFIASSLFLFLLTPFPIPIFLFIVSSNFPNFLIFIVFPHLKCFPSNFPFLFPFNEFFQILWIFLFFPFKFILYLLFPAFLPFFPFSNLFSQIFLNSRVVCSSSYFPHFFYKFIIIPISTFHIFPFPQFIFYIFPLFPNFSIFSYLFFCFFNISLLFFLFPLFIYPLSSFFFTFFPKFLNLHFYDIFSPP